MRRIFLDGEVFADRLNESCDFIAGETVETPKSVYFSVLYGTAQQLEDQHGKSIDSCHADAGDALIKDMQKKLFPAFKLGFNKSRFMPIAFTSMGPGNDFPFLEVCKIDGQGFSEADKAAVKEIAQQIIAEHNQKLAAPSVAPKANLFKSKKPAAAESSSRAYDANHSTAFGASS